MKRWFLSVILIAIALSLGAVVWQAAADRQARAESGLDSALLSGQPPKGAAEAAPSELPKAVVLETEFDFGVYDVDQTGEHEFVVRNEGQAELVLRPGSSSCKCTLIDLPQGVIPPGGEG